MPILPTPRLVPLVLASLALVAAGCGGDPEEEAASTAPTATVAPTEDPGAALRDVTAKPPVTSPGGDPPTELVMEDIIKGEGATARKGKQVSVHYVGVAWSTGAEFDASWNGGQPFTFELGGGQVIPGWDEGVAGMREGGRRRLVIPPDMAYGPAGSGQIGPNETLIFVVDLLDVA